MKTYVNSEIRKISKQYSNYDFYLFGSFIENDIRYSDIDVLIIYDTMEQISSVRSDFKKIDTFEIFDLMFLSIDEEKEIKFVEKVKAVRI
ncbi:conserved hypothetical protein [Flavobacterium sp. 9R]|uniref:nucleotidyltransferase domain-containing protein n=1 Tax=Flavobacterium sp. 9R TaxID=2653143 RepID=UPI0012F24461|nr:nucleotidyltransferase domain-containing protein [Flavobacterium sp. 9R]VXB58008.1 conserved hypothetical protein [Flavobacterium sp. 9R]